MKDTQGPEESQGWERKGNGLLPRMLWAYEAGQQFHLSATQSAVLLNLAFHMHKDRAEWAMAQDSIAKETRLSAKTVSRAFDVLIRRELVILLRSGKGSLSQATNVYSLAGFKTKWQLIDADTPEKVGTESPKTDEAIGHCVQSWDRESENGTQSPMSWDTVSENGTQSPNNPSVTLPSTYPSSFPFPAPGPPAGANNDNNEQEKRKNEGEREEEDEKKETGVATKRLRYGDVNLEDYPGQEKVLAIAIRIVNSHASDGSKAKADQQIRSIIHSRAAL